MFADSSESAATVSPTNRHARLRVLLVATAGLVGCRILSAWHSGIAAVAALAILAVLAVGWARTKPWLRRGLFYVALPLAVVGNAAVFAVTAFAALLGVLRLAPYGDVAEGVPWSAAFLCVPLATAVNLAACARRRQLPRRWLLGATAAANLAAAAYALWFWQVKSDSAPTAAVVFLFGVMSVTWLTVVCEAPGVAAANEPPRTRRRPWRVAFVTAGALLVCVPFWIAAVPKCRHRVLHESLRRLGFVIDLDVAFRVRSGGPILQPFWQYLGEPAAAHAIKLRVEDVPEAGRLLSESSALQWLRVEQVPEGGEHLLAPLIGRVSPMQICVGGPGTTDATLADVAAFPALAVAEFPNARITDEGLAKLSVVVPLQMLFLNRTPLTGAGLVHLQTLPRLGTLELRETQIGDDELRHLTSFPALRRLDLSNTRVTDAGLAHLAGCKWLTSLELRRTRVTDAGINRLKAALPGCKIEWDGTKDNP